MAGPLALGLLGAWLARVAHPIASVTVLLPLVEPLYETSSRYSAFRLRCSCAAIAVGTK
jgi:hypothetical protein